MTAPTGTNLPVGQFPGIPVHPDGTPNFGGAAPGPDGTTGQQNIWNLPKGLPPRLWFDVGHKTAGGDLANEDRGGLHPGRLDTPDRTPSSYQILKSPTQIMAQFAAMSVNPDMRPYLALQQTLGVKLTGKWDAATKGALAGAMQDYVQVSMGTGAGISFKDWLSQNASRAAELGLDGPQQRQVQLTDPTEIRAAVQSAAQDALGMGLSEEQMSKFVTRFQAAQSASQTSLNASVTSPDLSSDAMAYAQKTDPGAFKQNQRQAYLSSLVNLLGGGLTSRPNQAPVASTGGGQ